MSNVLVFLAFHIIWPFVRGKQPSLVDSHYKAGTCYPAQVLKQAGQWSVICDCNDVHRHSNGGLTFQWLRARFHGRIIWENSLVSFMIEYFYGSELGITHIAYIHLQASIHHTLIYINFLLPSFFNYIYICIFSHSDKSCQESLTTTILLSHRSYRPRLSGALLTLLCCIVYQFILQNSVDYLRADLI